MTFISVQFYKRCLNHQSLKSVWKLHIWNFIQISQGPMSLEMVTQFRQCPMLMTQFRQCPILWDIVLGNSYWQASSLTHINVTSPQRMKSSLFTWWLEQTLKSVSFRDTDRLPLAAPEVVVKTTSAVDIGDKVGITTMIVFQWNSRHCDGDIVQSVVPTIRKTLSWDFFHMHKGQALKQRRSTNLLIT